MDVVKERVAKAWEQIGNELTEQNLRRVGPTALGESLKAIEEIAGAAHAFGIVQDYSRLSTQLRLLGELLCLLARLMAAAGTSESTTTEQLTSTTGEAKPS